MFCKAKRQKKVSIRKSVWDELPWKDILSNLLQNHMGQKPGHFPKTEVKVTYDNESLCLMFRIEDRYVRAIAKTHQSDRLEKMEKIAIHSALEHHGYSCEGKLNAAKSLGISIATLYRKLKKYEISKQKR